jgi:hypothetical protein
MVNKRKLKELTEQVSGTLLPQRDDPLALDRKVRTNAEHVQLSNEVAEVTLPRSLPGAPCTDSSPHSVSRPPHGAGAPIPHALVLLGAVEGRLCTCAYTAVAHRCFWN